MDWYLYSTFLLYLLLSPIRLSSFKPNIPTEAQEVERVVYQLKGRWFNSWLLQYPQVEASLAKILTWSCIYWDVLV